MGNNAKKIEGTVLEQYGAYQLACDLKKEKPFTAKKWLKKKKKKKNLRQSLREKFQSNNFYEVIIRLSVSESYRNCLKSVGGVGFQMQHLFF